MEATTGAIPAASPPSMLSSTPSETTYIGRLKKYISLVNPIHLKHSEASIKAAQTRLHSSNVTTVDGFKADKTLVDACVHPTTGLIIPWYGRMSAFIPINIPLCAGLLFASTVPSIIFWQASNQTYNAIFNYSNSAKTAVAKSDTALTDKVAEPYVDKSVMKGYCGAVVVSVALSVGMTQWLRRAQLTPAVRSALQKVVPYTAVASAGVSNVVLMRYPEINTGIDVSAPDGTPLGRSKMAAKKAIWETAVSRAVLSGPILLLPPPLIALAFRTRLLTATAYRKRLVELSCVTLGVAVGLPCAIALYPQYSVYPVNKLEEEVQQLMKKLNEERGTHWDQVVFNKGV